MRTIKFGGIVNMGKRLAIKGHPTRGNEVIELLEMLGGRNIYKLLGNNSYVYYANDVCQNIIRGSKDMFDNFDDDTLFFTLEEFLNKYPYKVGDKIPDIWGTSLTVKSMSWDENYKTVMYGFKDAVFVARADELQSVNEIKPLFKAGDVVKLKGDPDENLFWIVMDVVKDGYIFNDAQKIPFDEQHHYEKSNREVMLTGPTKMKNVLAELLEHIKTTPKEELEKEFKEIEDWSNVGPTVEEFITFCESVNKKPTYTYPANYDECKAVLQLQDSKIQARCGYEWRLISYFQQLLMCRNAYWKIAGEQMGLDGPWEPDWNDHNQPKFGIHNVQNNIRPITLHVLKNLILVFPTEEMRDAFYKNFDYLIDACKELL